MYEELAEINQDIDFDPTEVPESSLSSVYIGNQGTYTFKKA